MPKVGIHSDERYPDYSFAVAEKGDRPWFAEDFEVDELTVARWELAHELYVQAQTEMGALISEREEAEKAVRAEERRAVQRRMIREEQLRREAKNRLRKARRDGNICDVCGEVGINSAGQLKLCDEHFDRLRDSAVSS